jgi:hypothetical protein
MAEAIAEPEISMSIAALILLSHSMIMLFMLKFLEFIEEQLAPMGGIFGESICHMCWVDATPNLKKAGFNKRIFVVGRFRILVVKKGTFGRSVRNT